MFSLLKFLCKRKKLSIEYQSHPKTQLIHGRHVSVYFAVYRTLVLAFRVAEVDCKLQLAARPSGLQTCSPLGRPDSCRLPSQLRMEFEEEAQMPFGSGRPAAV